MSEEYSIFNEVHSIVRETLEDSENIDLNNEGWLFVNSLRELKFTDEQIKIIVALKSNLCRECENAPVGCHCWNDE